MPDPRGNYYHHTQPSYQGYDPRYPQPHQPSYNHNQPHYPTPGGYNNYNQAAYNRYAPMQPVHQPNEDELAT